MTLDINMYTIQRPFVKLWVERKIASLKDLTLVKKELLTDVSLLAISTECPLLAIIHYVLEIIEDFPEMWDKEAYIRKFYKIKEVRNGTEIKTRPKT